MSKNETPNQQEQQQMESIFSQVKQAQVDVSPYLRTRVLAHLNENKFKRKLFFWKVFSAGSVAALVLVAGLSWQMFNKSTSDAMTQQAYVIHLDFNQNDQTAVAQAEIELPQDVYFVTSNKELKEEKKLKLPVEVKSFGRGKLPFVVSSHFSGEKKIKVRLLNENDELVREQVLTVKFAKQGEKTVF